MDILIANLHKHTAAFMQKFPCQQKTVAQVGEIGMDAEFPGVTERLDHFGFLGEVVVLAVFDIALVDERLKVGAVFDAIGRVNVNHLDLPRHALFFEKGVHDDERIPGDETVGPVVFVFVKFDGFAEGRVLGGRLKKGELQWCGGVGCFTNRFNDGARVYALVDVERLGRDGKGEMLGFACPLELRVEMRVVGVGFLRGREVGVGGGGDHADGRVVGALGFGVLIGVNRFGAVGGAFLNGFFDGEFFGAGGFWFGGAGHEWLRDREIER